KLTERPSMVRVQLVTSHGISTARPRTGVCRFRALSSLLARARTGVVAGIFLIQNEWGEHTVCREPDRHSVCSAQNLNLSDRIRSKRLRKSQPMKLEARADGTKRKAKKAIDLSGLKPTDHEGRVWNIVIETPKGSHHKFKYMPEHGLFGLHRVLPTGSIFPY